MNANKQDAGGLPDLPEPEGWTFDGGECIPCNYTADQMRAYGELCRAAPAGGDSWPLEVGDALLKWNRSHPAGPLISIGYEYGVAAKVAEIMRDSAPAGSGEVHPIPQELFDRAHRLRELAAANRLNECLPTIETMCGKNAGDAIRDAAALLRKLQQGAE